MYDYEGTPKGNFFPKILLLGAGFTLGFLIFKIFFFTYKIKDNSMLPNLKKGDIVFSMKYISPKAGDMVVYSPPSQKEVYDVKRIIAENNDVIEVKNKKIYINGYAAKFKWKILQKNNSVFSENFTKRDNMSLYKINSNEYFLIGDNLDKSFDSREFGSINENAITGVALFSY